MSKPTSAKKVQYELENLQDCAKFMKAVRETPEKVRAFIDSLPNPDTTIAGAEVGAKVICLQCLTDEEKAGLDDEKSYVSGMSRDNADSFELICARCGKRL